jgi:hypothetical protein
MSIEEVRAERFAQLFHHYHQALMTDDNGSSNPQTESWDQVPPTREEAPGIGGSPDAIGIVRERFQARK